MFLETLKRFIPEPLILATRPLRRYFEAQRRFDRRLGVETSEALEVDNLDASAEVRRHASGYEATSPAAFRAIMRILTGLGIPLERYAFLDMGSGKAAVLLYALHYPFRRILGVELSARLHSIAQRNLEAARRLNPRLASRPVENVCMNVVAYPIPAEPLLCFLYNPFKGDTLDRVVDNVRRSLAEHPRGLLIVYYHSLSRHEAWDKAGFLRTVLRSDDLTIYRPTVG
ncbi:MAG: class I SAM-dependent methyltransferase [Candidatus Polarisedimenticolia bacterium]